VLFLQGLKLPLQAADVAGQNRDGGGALIIPIRGEIDGGTPTRVIPSLPNWRAHRLRLTRLRALSPPMPRASASSA
jgi:hypothetical protein